MSSPFIPIVQIMFFFIYFPLLLVLLIIYFVLMLSKKRMMRDVFKIIPILCIVLSPIFFVMLYWYWALLNSVFLCTIVYIIIISLKKEVIKYELKGITSNNYKIRKQQEQAFESLSEEEKEVARQKVRDNPIKILHPAICFALWIGIPLLICGILSAFNLYFWSLLFNHN